MSIQRVVEGTLILLVLSTALVLTACNAGLRHTSGIDSLILELYANRSHARVGEPIQMQFVITNRGRNHIIIESPDTPVMDIIVEVVAGPELLSWSAQNPDKVAHRLELKPGESKIVELIWIPRQEDIYIGAFRDVFLTGLLNKDGKIVQSAGVTVCASNVCR